MGGTTFKAIRAVQEGILVAATPTLLPAHRFRRWETFDVSFEDWCKSGNDPFRVFEIQHELDYADERYLDQYTESVVHTETILVAYPNQVDWYGERLENIIDQDVTDITRLIGQRGYASYSALGTGQHNALRIGTFIQDQGSSRILGLRLQLEYDRSIP